MNALSTTIIFSIFVLAIFFSYILKNPESFFKCDYTDYFIKENISYNVCGEEIRRTYQVFYAVLTPWKKKYVTFDYPDESKEKVITDYKKLTVRTTTITLHENVCETLLDHPLMAENVTIGVRYKLLDAIQDIVKDYKVKYLKKK